MSRSRAVFAKIEAAMISWIDASPLTTASQRTGSRGVLFPSTNTRSTTKPVRWIRANARSIACREAWRIFTSSISFRLAQATPQAVARSFMMRSASSLFFSESRLESLSISIGKSSGRTTAAAQTGPASGPRPASSIPHTYRLIPRLYCDMAISQRPLAMEFVN